MNLNFRIFQNHFLIFENRFFISRVEGFDSLLILEFHYLKILVIYFLILEIGRNCWSTMLIARYSYYVTSIKLTFLNIFSD